jgi:hypothetical protein
MQTAISQDGNEGLLGTVQYRRDQLAQHLQQKSKQEASGHHEARSHEPRFQQNPTQEDTPR